MSVSSRQPLIRISKNGEMRLKNKVGVAILKENAHEDRALNSQIVALKKHQARQDKYMTYRQLDFATKQIVASEERPHTIATMTKHENALPPIHSVNLNDSMMRKTTAELNREQDVGAELRPQRNKGTWEKAMALVRVAVRNNRQKHETIEQNKTFITQPINSGKSEGKKRTKELESTTLPPLTASHHDTAMRYSRHRRGKLSTRQPSFPEMLKMSREKSKAGLQDPRFLKLQSCLGGTEHRKVRDSVRDKKQTTDVPSEVERRTRKNSTRKRILSDS